MAELTENASSDAQRRSSDDTPAATEAESRYHDVAEEDDLAAGDDAAQYARVDAQRRSATMFDDVHERRVTFCLDTSGSMYDCLDSIKQQLIVALERRARRPRDDDAFNVVEFSTRVIQWADEMVTTSPSTVAVAAQWLRSLLPKTGTNTRDALVAALSDPRCNAVCLVTDSVPDQPAGDVVDAVLRAAGSRPIHCRYIRRCDGPTDPAAVAFLRELATETFGSLLVVTVSLTGDVETVTPVYRAELTAERPVRTTTGNIYPTAYKMCSVGTALDSIPTPAPVAAVVAPAVPPWPYCLYPWPYRYYHVLQAGDRSSMRWRPAKAWMKHTREFADRIIAAPVPGAGAMLVGTRVLARRHRDGFFYMGTVKSQLLDNQFLVEFGPCKHGKFTDTEYQETFVYDIVALADALRHPVMVDDKVLAPWEAEGERYAPAVVISGHERRMADGGEEDRQLVATFHDGKTVTVPRNKAMWIPHDLYERTVFEIGLPKNVRQEFATQDFYPYQTTYGYPPSGPLAFPAQFDRHVPQGFMPGSTVAAAAGWVGTPCRGYPWMTRSQSAASVLRPSRDNADGHDEMIPGTELTKSQLNRKVMAQIQQSGLAADSRRLTLDGIGNGSGILKKSVSFVEGLEDVEHLSDSGHGSQADLDLSDMDDEKRLTEYGGGDVDGRGRDAAVGTRDAAVGTRPWSRSRRRPRSGSPTRRWRYWGSDPAPSLLDPMHYGRYREGPYRDCADSISTMLRDAKKSDCNNVEWTSPMDHVVDTYACYKYEPGVKDCLGYIPAMVRSGSPTRQAPGRDPAELLGTRQLSAEQQADRRQLYRQRQVLAREIGWQRRVADEQQAHDAALDARRQRSSVQLDRDRARADDQRADAERRLDAKRQQRRDVDERYRQNVDELGERQARRIAAMAEKLTQRNVEAAERAAEQAETHARRQASREVRNVARMEAHIARVTEQERQAAEQRQQNVRSRAARTADFRRKEIEAQQRKQLAAEVADQQRAIYRSQVLP